MAKDPAFLFYSSDFLTGTALMTDEQVGKYMRMLCLQHQKGHFTEKQLIQLSGNDPEIIAHFKPDAEGKFFNKRLDLEAKKRADYTASRRKNLHKDEHINPHMETHTDARMENENDNENVITNKNDFGKSENLLGRNLPTTEVKVVPLVVEPDFETFWNLYDKKVDRKAAEKLWSKLSKTDKEKIIEHVPKYTRSKPDKQFRKDPDGYLRSESWNDEIITPNGNTNTLRSTAQVGTATSAGKF